MRRGSAWAFTLLLLAAALACPGAEADDHRKRGRGLLGDEARDEPPPVEEEPPAPRKPSTARSHASWLDKLRRDLDDVPAPLGLMMAAMAGLLLLGLAALAARRAFRPPPPKPAKRSFDAGRARGAHDGMRNDPLESLRRAGLGEVEEVSAQGSARLVALRRSRGTPCEYAAGYLAGLFEGAWAGDVRVEHPACAGKERKSPCVYLVRPAPPPARAGAPADAASRGDGRAAAPSTRG